MFQVQGPMAGCIMVRLGVDPQLRRLTGLFQLWPVLHDPPGRPPGRPPQPELHRVDQASQVRPGSLPLLHFSIEVFRNEGQIPVCVVWVGVTMCLMSRSLWPPQPSAHLLSRSLSKRSGCWWRCSSPALPAGGAAVQSELIDPWTTVTVCNTLSHSDCRVCQPSFSSLIIKKKNPPCIRKVTSHSSSDTVLVFVFVQGR